MTSLTKKSATLSQKILFGVQATRLAVSY